MAIGVLGVLSLSGTSAIYFSSTNERSAHYSKDNGEAYELAEGGINEMMSVLWKKQNNALNRYLLPQTTSTYSTGTVTWYGVLDEQQAVWSLTSIGKVKNATGATKDVTRKLTAKVPVSAVVAAELNNQSWNYIMSTQVTGAECDMTIGSDVEVRTNLFVFGNLCLEQSAQILNGSVTSTKLAVKGKVVQKTNQNTIGKDETNGKLQQVTVVKSCKWFTSATYDPCQARTESRIFTNAFSTTNPAFVAPTSDYNRWYLNANPGPFFPCHTTTGTPPVFDSPVPSFASSDETKLTYKNNNQSVFNLTGPSSYSCTTPIGSIAWNATTKVLTVSGTMYIDGDLKMEFNAPTAVQYNGQATIYLSGSLLMKNAKICGGLLGTGCDFDTWNPNTEMLVFAADGDNRQPSVDAGMGIQLLSSQLQGALFATKKIKIDTFSKVDGPMIATEVVLGQSVDTNDYPNITTVPAGMPGEDNVYAQPNSPQLYSG